VSIEDLAKNDRVAADIGCRVDGSLVTIVASQYPPHQETVFGESRRVYDEGTADVAASRDGRAGYNGEKTVRRDTG